MPTDVLTEVGHTAVAFTLVGVVAIPLGVSAWLLSRWQSRPLVPRFPAPTRSWNGFDILLLFVASVVLLSVAFAVLSSAGFFRLVYGAAFPENMELPNPDANAALVGEASVAVLQSRIDAANQLRFLWSSALAVPLLMLTAWVLCVVNSGTVPSPNFRELPSKIALGVVAWAVLTPITLIVHLASNLLTHALGGTPSEHPLTQITFDSRIMDVILFAVMVCFLTPLAEEFLFRGILIGWLMRRRYRVAAVLMVSVLLSGVRGGVLTPQPQFAAVGFALLLALSWAAVANRTGGKSSRTYGAVHASAALFAAAHASVWPTPIPLYVLGFGLGWLTVRTGGIAAGTVAHGLFNAVAFVMLLRGGANG